MIPSLFWSPLLFGCRNQHSRAIQDDFNGQPVRKRRILAQRVFGALFSESERYGNDKSRESAITFFEEENTDENIGSFYGEDILKNNVQASVELTGKCYREWPYSSALSKPFQNDMTEISPYDQYSSREESRRRPSSPRFILSSGRTITKGSQPVPTVDKEFEKYFASLFACEALRS